MAFNLQWFPFYPGDFFQDGKVQMMSLEQIGAYIKLLSFQWREGSIPAERGAITRILNLDDDEFDELWPLLSECFPKVPDKRGRLANHRLEEERAMSLTMFERRQNKARTAARARWDHSRLNGRS